MLSNLAGHPLARRHRACLASQMTWREAAVFDLFVCVQAKISHDWPPTLCASSPASVSSSPRSIDA